jgi:hypothetical protein
MVYKDDEGLSSTVHLVNQDSDAWADLRIRFVEPSGSTRLVLRDWLCPNGSRHYPLASLVDLPADWSGSVRVEARDVFPGGAAPEGPGSEQGGNSRAAPSLAGSVGHASQLDPDHLIAAYPMFRERVQIRGSEEEEEVEAMLVGLADGLGVVAIPSLGGLSRAGDGGAVSGLALQLGSSGVSWAEVGAYFFDGNGLVDQVCRRLYSEQLWRLDSRSLGFLGPEFRGSAVISASRWQVDPRASKQELEQVGLLAVVLSESDSADASWAAASSAGFIDAAGASTGLWLYDRRLLEDGWFCEPDHSFGPPCP